MEFLLRKLDFHMDTDDIFLAWEEIGGLISTLQDAVNNRLRDIGYDENSYDWENSSDECNDLLRLRDILNNIEY